VLTNAQTAKDFYNRAVNKYEDKEYAAAAIEYTRALEIAPESAVLFNNRGLCYFKMEQWDKAEDDYDRAVYLDPEYKQAFLNLGNVFLDKAEYDNAVLSFDKALDIDSSYTPIFAKKAYVLYQLEDYKSALYFYKKAIESIPVAKASLYNARGATYAKLGKPELAIADYDKTLSLTPDAYETYINRGILKTELQKYEGAIQDFTVAQSFAGMSGEGYYYRGLCRVGQLDAIRTSKEKHFVMDIKENQKLLELACSDFEKAKQFSYGRAFEAHQEYCVEKDKDIVAVKTQKEENIESNLQAEPDSSIIIDTTAEPKELEVSEVASTLTATERENLKDEIKAEIISELLAEYVLVPRSKQVSENIKDTTDSDTLVGSEVIPFDSTVLDSFASEHLRYDNYRDSIIQLFDSSSGSHGFKDGYYEADSLAEVESFYYKTDTIDSLVRISLIDLKGFVTDFIYIKDNEVLIHISQYTDLEDEASVPEVHQELSVFENNEIIYQKSADCGAPNNQSYIKSVNEYILEVVKIVSKE
jgi:tetratricopeptide (TPR) repeat protein